MQGPFPQGTYGGLAGKTAWERCVVRGQRYRVVKAFRDYDRDLHAVGEQWYFLGSSFLPGEDGLSIVVADDRGDEWHIRLCWRPEEQQHVCEKFGEYVEAVQDGSRPA